MADRRITRRSILAREKMMKHRIRAMSTAEKLRLAADFLDDERMGTSPDPKWHKRGRLWALNVAKLVVSELEKEVAGG